MLIYNIDLVKGNDYYCIEDMRDNLLKQYRESNGYYDCGYNLVDILYMSDAYYKKLILDIEINSYNSNITNKFINDALQIIDYSKYKEDYEILLKLILKYVKEVKYSGKECYKIGEKFYQWKSYIVERIIRYLKYEELISIKKYNDSKNLHFYFKNRRYSKTCFCKCL